MKRLPLKEKKAPKAKPFAAMKVLEKAKKDIKSQIYLQSFMLHQSIYGAAAGFGEDGECTICTGDLIHDIHINVLTVSHNKILNTTTYDNETVEIAEITVLLDGTVILINEDGDEWTDSEVTLEELADVCNALEATNRKRKEESK